MSLVTISEAGPASMPLSAITAATASAGVGCARAWSTVSVCSGFAPSSASFSRTNCISGAGVAISCAAAGIVAAASVAVMVSWTGLVCAIAPLGKPADAITDDKTAAGNTFEVMDSFLS